jgi:hypothetical protein
VNFYNFAYVFALTEMQVIIAGAMGHDLTQQHLADILKPQLSDKQSALSLALARKGLRLDEDRLLSKLENLDPQKLRAFQETIERVAGTDPFKLFEEGDVLPSIHVLRSLGLAAPTGKPSWAYVVILIEDGRYIHEVVLHEHAENLSVPDVSVEKLSQAAVERVRELRDDGHPESDTFLGALCCAMVVNSGEHYLRVSEDAEGKITVTKIPDTHLRGDIADGSLRRLVLPGVNAPAHSGRSRN